MLKIVSRWPFQPAG